MGRGRAWSATEKEELRLGLQQNGGNAYAIAAEHGWSYSSTKKEAKRMAIGGIEERKGKWTVEAKKALSDHLRDKPDTSIRTARKAVKSACPDFECSLSLVYRAMIKDKQPYKTVRMQALTENHKAQRLEVSKKMLRLLAVTDKRMRKKQPASGVSPLAPPVQFGGSSGSADPAPLLDRGLTTELEACIDWF